jgi:hypothetical protein
MAEVNKYVLWRHLLDPNSELYIYLEQELQWFGLREKWSQDGGHWHPIVLKVVNSFNTIFPS